MLVGRYGECREYYCLFLLGSLFTFYNITVFSELLNAVEPKISLAMNQNRTMDFQEVEVREAFKQMYPLKALGLDSMPLLFFQRLWPMMGNVITKKVLDFLNFGVPLANFNNSHIVLVPKMKEPKKVTDFCRIGFFNIINKLASKATANGLKKFLPSIISETQSDFLHGRLITDNVRVAFETMHHIN